MTIPLNDALAVHAVFIYAAVMSSLHSADCRLRLLTLNIRFGSGSAAAHKPGYDLPVSRGTLWALADAIGSVEPDAAALQEVRNARQAERIAERLKMNWVYVAHPAGYAFDFFEWGLAFVFRRRLTGTFSHCVFFDQTSRSGRQCLAVTLEVGKRTVTLVNVHLAPQDTGRQVGTLLEAVAGVRSPLVCMGDFNCGPDAGGLAAIRQKMADTCTAAATAGAREAQRVGTLVGGTRRIDHIFASREDFMVEEAGLVAERHRRVSDHIGYCASLRFKEPHEPE